MNYHPVIPENQTNSHAGFQDTKKAREEGTHTYVLFPVLFDGYINSQNNNKDSLVDGKEHDDDIQKSVDLNAEFKECTNNSSNGINAASSLVSTAVHNFINNTNDFSAAGPSNAAASPTATNSSDMPNLEDLTHSNDADDVGAEADINNLESIISVKQNKDGIFINQDKYVAKILKKFGLSEGKSASTPIDAEKPLLKDSDGEDVDVHRYRLHMDLFGPTFVKILSKKSYCLVITDDYSRFSWVFFLASKDETNPVLKTFILGLENLLSLKVKVIKCDNGTEFKNSDLDQFCGLKGIKREFSVPRTPQQNGPY
uniref:Putative ribonuclease H-like domain-containing protein n=1 Tax=Tanacetum cinerariifolium TaxID=118510 RepID=A0A699KEA1_TANCI|nr:putative ribonuclease H-like domain-containing protein [Tanacetum cinerariifolium]